MSEAWDGDVQNAGRPWSGDGREALADEVRRLISLTVTSAAPPEVLAGAGDALRDLADRLELHVPEPGDSPAGRFAEPGLSADRPGGLAAAMPFDVVIGTCNPLAPPLTIEFDPPNAIGHGVFTSAYEGAPGCVHGAMLAGAFDIVLTAANVQAGQAGPTRTLSIRYLRPTLIDTPSRFEAWVTGVEGRRIRSAGRLLQGGVVCVEAEGEFVSLDRPLIESLYRRGSGAGGGAVRPITGG
jgi:Thioesterase superfamily